jgi:hypothetical protein
MHQVARLLVGLFVASVPLVVWGAEPAAACSCGVGTEPEHLADADAVFVGTATRIDGRQPRVESSSIDPVTWTFSVESVVKGDVGAEQQVTTAATSASCGLELSAGQAYVVFASVNSADGTGPLQAGLCGGTRPAVPGEQPAGLPTGSRPTPAPTETAAPAADVAADDGEAMPWLVATAVVLAIGASAAALVVRSRRAARRPAA